MKQNIKFSAYSLIVTAVVLILCVVGIFLLLGDVEILTLSASNNMSNWSVVYY